MHLSTLPTEYGLRRAIDMSEVHTALMYVQYVYM